MLTHHIKEMTKDLFVTLKEHCCACSYFAIALNKSTDVKDTSQLAIFFHGVTNDFYVHEEFVQLVPMKVNTNGANILAAVLLWVEDFSLDLAQLCGVMTDGAPTMTGSWKGFVSLLVKHCHDLGCTQKIHTLHCIVHQEALCTKSATLNSVITITIKAVNLVLSHALNHQQFKSLLWPMPSMVTCCTIVRCAGSTVGGCFSGPTSCMRSWSPSSSLKDFCSPELRNPAWCCNFAFAVDLMGHLNTLNTSLQMKNLLMLDVFSNIKAFCVKLMLWEGQLCGGDFSYFKRLASCNLPQCVIGCYADVIRALKEQFVS